MAQLLRRHQWVLALCKPTPASDEESPHLSCRSSQHSISTSQQLELRADQETPDTAVPIPRFAMTRDRVHFARRGRLACREGQLSYRELRFSKTSMQSSQPVQQYPRLPSDMTILWPGSALWLDSPLRALHCAKRERIHH